MNCLPVVGLLDEGVEVPRGRVVFVLHVLLHLIQMFALIREAAKKVIFLVARPLRPRALWQHFFGHFFFELQKKVFLLVAQPLK